MSKEDIMRVEKGVLLGLIVAFPAGAFGQELGPLAPDRPVRSAETDVVCTGVGIDARENSAWAAYPLKVEVVGRGGQYLGDVRVALSQRNKAVISLTCGGPWILFRLPTGRYQVEAKTENQTVSSSAFVPATGQGRIILRFPELGGEVTSSIPKAESVAQPAMP
jgi:hypothetical protein